MNKDKRYVKAISGENFIFVLVFFGFLGLLGHRMGVGNMLMTMMNTAYSLLIDTCLYILAISVLAGAIAALFSEFGFIALVNSLLTHVMGPLYDLPGAASLGILNCYMSDNPSILTLADQDDFKRYFKKYQLPALTNLGTSFGMGLIVTSTMVALSVEGAGKAALIGNIGAIVGSIFSVRIMLHFTKRVYGNKDMMMADDPGQIRWDLRYIRDGNVGTRFMTALLEGGKSGVEMGVSIIPGVVIICTLVFMLTNGPSSSGLYTGAAYEGIPVIPWLGDKLSFIFDPLFGFKNPQSISVPITALGSAGAAIGVVSKMAADAAVSANDLAVFTAICMCWSGYLSTHIAMMDALGTPEMTGKAILSHTIGGLMAGLSAHLICWMAGMV